MARKDSYEVQLNEEEKPKRGYYIACVVFILLCFLIASITGLLIFYLNNKREVLRSVIVDCSPHQTIDKELCLARGCTWTRFKDARVPNCYYDNKRYIIEKMDGSKTYLKMVGQQSIYGQDSIKVVLEVTNINLNTIRLKIKPMDYSASELPSNIFSPFTFNSHSAGQKTKGYTIQLSTVGSRFAWSISRDVGGQKLFAISDKGLILSPQYLQLTAELNSSLIFGFGENRHEKLRLNMSWNTLPLFARKSMGVHPFFLNLQKDSSAYGVFLRNSHAMEVALQPDPFPAISYRILGGIFDFYIFLGPTPSDVVRQYIEIIGRPMMPPRWSLGLYLGGIHDNFTNFAELIDRNNKMNIPFEAIHSGSAERTSGLGWRMEETTNLSTLIRNKKYVYYMVSSLENSPTNDAVLKGKKPNIFIYKADSQMEFVAKSGLQEVIYPDYSDDKSGAWLRETLSDFQQQNNLMIDGFILDKNEPYSKATQKCNKNKWNFPLFKPDIDQLLFDNTVCMDAKQSEGRHYQLHNIYGYLQSKKIYQALSINTSSRPFIASAITFPGSQTIAAHFLANMTNSWENLRQTLKSLLTFSILGYPMTGSDICGAQGEIKGSELCIRWMQLAALSPYTRSFTDDLEQPRDPASFDPLTTSRMKEALDTRRSLLPYLYTLFHQAHSQGLMPVQPLFFEFLSDKNTWNIDEQYMLGPSLLISPALYEKQTKVEAYFPKGRWFNYYLGEEIASHKGTHTSLKASLQWSNIHLRGGHIIPCLDLSEETKSYLILKIALDDKQRASGQLYWDNDSEDNLNYVTMNFTVENKSLNVVSSDLTPEELSLRHIVIHGLPFTPSSFLSQTPNITVAATEYRGGYRVTLQPPVTSVRFSLSWNFY